ncbi:MAG TPA: carboxypeptidase-like regulatory domain-containing protein [Candidatus Angelobacter sp.]|nr:carboxypeptidase-like regulatory domain-containing protein [Candidatus Angelobacter sp.]
MEKKPNKLRNLIAISVTLLSCAILNPTPVVQARSVSFEPAWFGGVSEPRVLTGHVRTGNDEPLPKAVVYLKNTKTLVIKTYITDADGSYRFPALSSNDDYEVYAEFQGTRSDTKTLSAFDNRKQLTVTLRIRLAK